jgi:nitrate reductase gamma subunit
MNPRPGTTPRVFLERQSYRRRRIMDAARLLPLIGAALLAVPLLWANPDAGTAEAVPMSHAIVYVFGVWAGLIVLSAGFGLVVRRWPDSSDATGAGTDLGQGSATDAD